MCEVAYLLRYSPDICKWNVHFCKLSRTLGIHLMGGWGESPGLQSKKPINSMMSSSALMLGLRAVPLRPDHVPEAMYLQLPRPKQLEAERTRHTCWQTPLWS